MGSLRVVVSVFLAALIGLLPDSGLAAPGDINTVAGGVGEVGGFSLISPSDVAVDGAGNVYIADTGQHRIFKLAAGTGVITPYAGNGTPGDVTQANSGDGGPAISATVNFPTSVAVDSAGNLYIAQPGTRCVRKVSAAGVISTVAGNWTRPARADIATRDIGDGGLATSTSLIYPQGVAVDSAGNLYIADFSDHRVRKVAAGTSIISTVAGNGVYGFSGDGGVATEANLSSPTGVAVDSAGRLYIADYFNDSVRRVTDGIITTGVGITAESDGTAAPVTLYRPYDVAVDSMGNLHIVEEGNHALRKVDSKTWVVSTEAGTPPVPGLAGEGVTALGSGLNRPTGVAVDPAGNIYLADQGNNRIAMLSDSIKPVGVSATGSNAQATVSFTPPSSDGGSAILYYTVTSSPDGVTGTGTASPITVTGLTNGTAYTFTVVATTAAGSGVSSAPSNSVTPAFMEYALNLLFAGTGGGMVNGEMSCYSGAGCPPALFEQHTVVTLMATRDVDSLFAGWSGPCAVEGSNCYVTMDDVKTVTATFNAAPRLKIQGGAEYNLLSDAHAAAASGAVILAREVEFNDGNLILYRVGGGVSVFVRGGYDSDFRTRTGSTAIKGKLVIKNGALRVDGVVLR